MVHVFFIKVVFILFYLFSQNVIIYDCYNHII